MRDPGFAPHLAEILHTLLERWLAGYEDASAETYAAAAHEAREIEVAVAAHRPLSHPQCQTLSNAVTHTVDGLTYQRIYPYAAPSLPVADLPERCQEAQRIIEAVSPLLGAEVSRWERSVERGKKLQFQCTSRDTLGRLIYGTARHGLRTLLKMTNHRQKKLPGATMPLTLENFAPWGPLRAAKVD